MHVVDRTMNILQNNHPQKQRESGLKRPSDVGKHNAFEGNGSGQVLE